MGKAQKKKAMRRHNPVRVPDSHLPKGLATASETSSKTNEILPIIQKMQGPDAAERRWACVAVSNLIQNDPSTRRLLQGRNVVGALIERLTDNEEEVIVEAAGALRNLCIDGGFDICAEMYNKNILTPLKASIPKIASTLSQFLSAPSTASEKVRKTVYELAENVITILWCLSETSNKALSAINEIHLVPFLMSFLSARGELPLLPVTAAAQCLYVLTDDNFPAVSELRSDASHVACLLSVAQTEMPNPLNQDQHAQNAKTLQVLASGILRNITPIPPPSAVSFVDIDKEVIMPLLQPVISSISLGEVTTSVQELIHRQASEPQLEKLSLKTTPRSDHKSQVELGLELLESKLRTVQLALEVLTGVCATLPEPEPPVEGEEEEEGEDIEDEVIQDAEMETVEEPKAPASTNSYASLAMPLLALIQPTALSFPPLSAPSAHPPTTSALSAVHIAALECLNNIFLSLASSPSPSISAEVTSGLQIWNAIWAALELVGTQAGPGQERRQEFWEIAVGVLWNVGRIWKGVLPVNSEQVSVLQQLCTATDNVSLRVKSIGTLESLAQNPSSIEGNKAVADFLFSTLPTPGTPTPIGTEPMVQVVNSIIDIYSDETMPYDINFRQGKYLERLVASLEEVRKAIRGIDRRKEGGRELRRHAEEARDNLVAFIQYRRELRL